MLADFFLWNLSNAHLTPLQICAFYSVECCDLLGVIYYVFSIYYLLKNLSIRSPVHQKNKQLHSKRLWAQAELFVLVKIPHRGIVSEWHTFTWQNSKHTFPSLPHKRLQAGNANRPSNYQKSEVICSGNCHPCRATRLLMVSSAVRERHPLRHKQRPGIPEQNVPSSRHVGSLLVCMPLCSPIDFCFRDKAREALFY